MAPQMAATVLCSSVFVLFLFVFRFSKTISFTRDELLNIRQNTPQNLLPDFDYSDVLLDIVIGGAVALVKRFRTRRWGKRAGALGKLRQRGLRTPLPSIHLANLRSLPNKTDELLLLSHRAGRYDDIYQMDEIKTIVSHYALSFISCCRKIHCLR